MYNLDRTEQICGKREYTYIFLFSPQNLVIIEELCQKK